MRLPMLVISLLAAVSGGAAAQSATVVAPAATVSGLTVTNAGTYTAQRIWRGPAAEPSRSISSASEPQTSRRAPSIPSNSNSVI
jgi:hypothetical protein